MNLVGLGVLENKLLELKEIGRAQARGGVPPAPGCVCVCVCVKISWGREMLLEERERESFDLWMRTRRWRGSRAGSTRDRSQGRRSGCCPTSRLQTVNVLCRQVD